MTGLVLILGVIKLNLLQTTISLALVSSSPSTFPEYCLSLQFKLFPHLEVTLDKTEHLPNVNEM